MGVFQNIQTIVFAGVGGILPAFVWLWFWLKEDKKHPEPRRLVALAFFAGMLIVFPVLKIETMVLGMESQTFRIFLWAVIEEIGKLGAAALVVLWRKDIDEPIDYAIYLITTALGFSALENSLFLINPFAAGLSPVGLVTSDLRFIGATLLHVTSSAIIGIMIGFSFYKDRLARNAGLIFGVILAIALHTAFNLSIITVGGKYSLFVSSAIWAIVIVLLVVMEKVKKVHPTN